uniref:Uncharacterized protein n=1 Tax=Arundo donax TaxID=35708 RepID=A0A0A9FME8_ARUDO
MTQHGKLVCVEQLFNHHSHCHGRTVCTHIEEFICCF